MQSLSSRLMKTAFFAAVIVLFSATLCAQSFWLERSAGKALAVEVYKPTANSTVHNGATYPVDYSFQTFAFFLGLRWPIGRKTFLVTELPFAHAAFDTKIDREYSFYRFSGQESALGNPYIGLRFGYPERKISFEAGLRLPLTQQEHFAARTIGRNGDDTREEAFEDLAALRAIVHYAQKRERGFNYHLALGPIIQRDFEHLGDHHFGAILRVEAWYQMARINMGANITMRGSYNREVREVHSEGQAVLDRRSNTTFKVNQDQDLTVGVKLGKLQPGISYSPFALHFGIAL